MNKLLRRCSLLLAFGLLCSVYTNAQVSKIDPNAGLRIIVVTDDNFEVKKPTSPVLRRSITCEAWITTDGKLHCKTGVKLTLASVKFTSPTYSSLTPAGDGTTAGGDKSIKLPVKELALGQDTYIWDISAEKYREMHSITLSIQYPLGSGQVVLINKKVPAQIVK